MGDISTEWKFDQSADDTFLIKFCTSIYIAVCFWGGCDTELMNSLFLNAKFFVGFPKTDDFGTLRLLVAHPISAIAHGINRRSLRCGADSADKRHDRLFSVSWFTPDWLPIARKCLSSIWLPWINKDILIFYCFHRDLWVVRPERLESQKK